MFDRLCQLFLLLTMTMVVAGCGSAMKIDIVTEIPREDVKTIVLLNENGYSSLVRRSLIKNGFEVQAQYDKNEAKYGIRHSGRYSPNNPCMTNGNASHFTVYEFELVDIETNSIILFVSKGGWTDWCTGAPTFETTDLFGDLSKELSKLINRKANNHQAQQN